MKTRRFAVLVIAATMSAGCSLVAPVTERVAQAVDRYCEEPRSARLVYRETINAQLAAHGHSVAVTCAGDTPE